MSNNGTLLCLFSVLIVSWDKFLIKMPICPVNYCMAICFEFFFSVSGLSRGVDGGADHSAYLCTKSGHKYVEILSFVVLVCWFWMLLCLCLAGDVKSVRGVGKDEVLDKEGEGAPHLIEDKAQNSQVEPGNIQVYHGYPGKPGNGIFSQNTPRKSKIPGIWRYCWKTLDNFITYM